MAKIFFGILMALLVDAAMGGELRTKDPLKAFIKEEYPWGSDYFIYGNADTYVFRCVMQAKGDEPQSIALSEVSIWGNHGGPWEVFVRTFKGDYRYDGNREVSNSSCVEWCGTKQYLATGRCSWQRGFPKMWKPGKPTH